MIRVSDQQWWQRAVFYQIYPRSFADSDGDGIGDLPGAISRLDYLVDLGIDAIWLSPHYPSPQFDCGYDVADYTAVAPEYGTLDDFKRLLDEGHRRGIRIILDLVLNHTSDQHRWFEESRSSRDNPKRDWYVWHDGAADGGPPNDWLSTFGGPAWENDPITGQYYYHFFFKEQPDLNWRNPEVKQAMFDGVRFWLDMGVDGFRLDAIGTIFEDASLPDHGTDLTLVDIRRRRRDARTEEEQKAAGDLWRQVFGSQVGLPEVHDLMKELRTLVDQYGGDRLLVGETENIRYHGNGDDELHLVFNFPLMWPERLTAAVVRENQEGRLGALPPNSWPCNTLGNHDSSRVYSRFGDGEHDDDLARLSLALMLTLRGTPFLYNGEEIGMTDLLLKDASHFRDMLGAWIYQAWRGEGVPAEDALRMATREGRDKCRTPMQWGRGPNGDFCPAGVEPWLPVNPNFTSGVNVAEQKDNPHSLLSFYRALLWLRRETPALICGGYRTLQRQDPNLLVFLREAEEQNCLVILNFSASAGKLEAAPGLPVVGRILFGTHRNARESLSLAGLPIAPFEFLLFEL